VALGIAAQFELTLRQIDVVGTWEKLDQAEAMPPVSVALSSSVDAAGYADQGVMTYGNSGIYGGLHGPGVPPAGDPSSAERETAHCSCRNQPARGDRLLAVVTRAPDGLEPGLKSQIPAAGFRAKIQSAADICVLAAIIKKELALDVSLYTLSTDFVCSFFRKNPAFLRLSRTRRQQFVLASF